MIFAGGKPRDVRSTSTIPSRKETLTLMSTWTCENISSVLCIPLFRTVSSVNLKWNFNHEALVEYRFINGETYLVMVECSDTSGFFQLRITVASHMFLYKAQQYTVYRKLKFTKEKNHTY